MLLVIRMCWSCFGVLPLLRFKHLEICANLCLMEIETILVLLGLLIQCIACYQSANGETQKQNNITININILHDRQ